MQAATGNPPAYPCAMAEILRDLYQFMIYTQFQTDLSERTDKNSFCFCMYSAAGSWSAILFCLNSFLLYSASIVRLYHRSFFLSNYFYSLFIPEYCTIFLGPATDSSHFLCIPNEDTLQ